MKEDSSWEWFTKVFKQTGKKCGNKLDDIRRLTFIIFFFQKSMHRYMNKNKKASLKCRNSLAFQCYLELVRISSHTLFLSAHGLYRNAFDNIRYVLESIVQALYIDVRHSQNSINTKIEILKEVEDKIEYHAIRLIDELQIENKDKLKKEYKTLSKTIHPSHRQIIATITDVESGAGIPARVDCEEIKKIYDSMKTMYDIFFYLLMTQFSDSKELLRKNTEFIKCVQTYELALISNTLGQKLKTKAVKNRTAKQTE